jgi:hypothetical protein
MNVPSNSAFDEIVRLVRGLVPLEKLKLIEQISPDLQRAPAVEEKGEFDRLMAEADADAVAVGHMDDSR